MTKKIQELLAVLDMSDSQQRLWLFTHIGKDTSNDRDLADLAFRLRDEAVELNTWGQAKELVAVYSDERVGKLIGLADGLSGGDRAIIGARNLFFVNRGRPIHFIDAALIAKELSQT